MIDWNCDEQANKHITLSPLGLLPPGHFIIMVGEELGRHVFTTRFSGPYVLIPR